MASRTSTIRIRTVSTRPPSAAGVAPIVPPIVTPMITDTTPDGEADPGAVDHPAELVAALQVGPHQVRRVGRLEPERRPGWTAIGSYGARSGARTATPTKIPMIRQADHGRPVAHQAAEGVAPEPAARRGPGRAPGRGP